jgi:hypothetical protein
MYAAELPAFDPIQGGLAMNEKRPNPDEFLGLGVGILMTFVYDEPHAFAVITGDAPGGSSEAIVALGRVSEAMVRMIAEMLGVSRKRRWSGLRRLSPPLTENALFLPGSAGQRPGSPNGSGFPTAQVEGLTWGAGQF